MKEAKVLQCRNTIQDNEMPNTNMTHCKMVPECSAPKRRQVRQPSITTMKIRMERKHHKMTKWLKCRNLAPDNKMQNTEDTAITQWLTKAIRPRQHAQRITQCKVATVHPHRTGTNISQPYKSRTHSALYSKGA